MYGRDSDTPLVTLVQQLQRDGLTHIDIDDLTASELTCAGDLAKVGELLARARAEALLAKAAVKAAEGYATQDAPAVLVDRGVKVTVDAVKAAVAVDGGVMMATNSLAVAEAVEHDLRSLFDAIKIRAQMLVSLGATVRAENRVSTY